MHEGENAAARRLFKGAESVANQQVVSEEYVYQVQDDDDECEEAPSATSEGESRCEHSSMSFTRPVEEWRKFLRNKERDVSVAKI